MGVVLRILRYGHGRNLGVQGGQLPLQYILCLRIVIFGCLVEEGQIKKYKYFQNN